MTILFTDFDGCAHKVHAKEEGEELFAYLPRIEAVVQQFPDVYIVVSSDWRLIKPWSEIVAVFSPAFRARVLGVLPTVRPRHMRAGGVRHLEAMIYLHQHGFDLNDWVAIDDEPRHWPADLKNVVICKDGFYKREEKLLRSALQRAGAR